MKKNKKLLPILIVSLMMLLILSTSLQACKMPNFNSSQKISAPKNNLIPIQGTWKITGYKTLDIHNIPNKSLVNKFAEFSESSAILTDEVCKNPKYKIKVVDMNNYIFYNYKVDYKKLGINKEKAEIISVTSKDKLFYDFIRINENKLLLYLDGTFYTLEKISNSTQNSSEITNAGDKTSKSKNKDSLLRSGVFIGLRADSNDIEKTPSTYRTIWISTINKDVTPILENKDIFVPRKTGFWSINIERTKKGMFEEDTINALPVDNKENENNSVLKSNSKITLKENLYRDILFVGNDYLSTEYSKKSTPGNNSSTLNKLQMLPMDNLNNKTGVKLSDLIGNIGSNVLKDSLNSFLSVRSDKKEDFQKQVPDEESFSLVRRNGHWIMTGRLNSNLDQNNYINFDLNIFPPKKLLNYDEMYLSWSDIKNHVPSAIDAFTSPNADIALVVCTDAIYVYSIDNKSLSTEPLSKIPIKQNESIVMTEWATGDYVEKWKESFENFIQNNKNLK